MKQVFLGLALALMFVSACGPPSPKPIDSTTIQTRLLASSLPITTVTVYDQTTDLNHLLGRPNQYTAKVSWHDTRARESDTPESTIEVFGSPADLHARVAYTDAISKSGGAFAQYIIPDEQRLVLVRLPHDLTPEQADQYRQWLTTL